MKNIKDLDDIHTHIRITEETRFENKTSMFARNEQRRCIRLDEEKQEKTSAWLRFAARWRRGGIRVYVSGVTNAHRG